MTQSATRKMWARRFLSANQWVYTVLRPIRTALYFLAKTPFVLARMAFKTIVHPLVLMVLLMGGGFGGFIYILHISDGDGHAAKTEQSIVEQKSATKQKSNEPVVSPKDGNALVTVDDIKEVLASSLYKDNKEASECFTRVMRYDLSKATKLVTFNDMVDSKVACLHIAEKHRLEQAAKNGNAAVLDELKKLSR